MSCTLTVEEPPFGPGAASTDPSYEITMNLPARHEVAPFPVSQMLLLLPLM